MSALASTQHAFHRIVSVTESTVIHKTAVQNAKYRHLPNANLTHTRCSFLLLSCMTRFSLPPRRHTRQISHHARPRSRLIEPQLLPLFDVSRHPEALVLRAVLAVCLPASRRSCHRCHPSPVPARWRPRKESPQPPWQFSAQQRWRSSRSSSTAPPPLYGRWDSTTNSMGARTMVCMWHRITVLVVKNHGHLQQASVDVKIPTRPAA